MDSAGYLRSEGGGEGAYSDRGDVLMLKVLVVGQGAHGNGGDCSSETSSASGLLRCRCCRRYRAHKDEAEGSLDAGECGEYTRVR